jgi:hypothetical protein
MRSGLLRIVPETGDDTGLSILDTCASYHPYYGHSTAFSVAGV